MAAKDREKDGENVLSMLSLSCIEGVTSLQCERAIDTMAEWKCFMEGCFDPRHASNPCLLWKTTAAEDDVERCKNNADL